MSPTFDYVIISSSSTISSRACVRRPSVMSPMFDYVTIRFVHLYLDFMNLDIKFPLNIIYLLAYSLDTCMRARSEMRTV